MRISYNKLLKLFVDKEMSVTELRRKLILLRVQATG